LEFKEIHSRYHNTATHVFDLSPKDASQRARFKQSSQEAEFLKRSGGMGVTQKPHIVRANNYSHKYTRLEWIYSEEN